MGIAMSGSGKDVGEGHIQLFTWNYTSNVQGTWAFRADAGQINAFDFDNNGTKASGDGLDFYVYLRGGATYTLTGIGVKATTAGITKFQIGKTTGSLTTVASFDMYNNPVVNNSRQTQTGITPSEGDGLYILRMYSDTKNAAASNYLICWNSIALIRTA